MSRAFVVGSGFRVYRVYGMGKEFVPDFSDTGAFMHLHLRLVASRSSLVPYT